MTYTVNYTNKNKTPIIINDSEIDTSTSITLFGRKRLAYGEDIQENLLHILENFSCPEDASNPGNPDLNKAIDGVFTHLTEGQCWYNSTQGLLNFYDGTHWIPLAREDDIAANWGMIQDGGYLPNPISPLTGEPFPYNECVWIVSPQSIPNKIDYYVCKADASGKVTMQYRFAGGQVMSSGIANYLIVGITGNVNHDTPIVTPTPTPTITPTVSHPAINYQMISAKDGSIVANGTPLAATGTPQVNGSTGMTCGGSYSSCSLGSTGTFSDVNFLIKPTGGNGPYKVSISSITRNQADTTCLNFGYGNGYIPVNTTSISTTTLLKDNGNGTFGPLAVQSECTRSTNLISGTIYLTITDSLSYTQTIQVNYTSQLSFINTPIFESPPNISTLCPDTAPTNLAPIGSPYFLHVQNDVSKADALTNYYMVQNFNFPISGTYTFKFFNDDDGYLYIDGNNVFYGLIDNVCAANQLPQNIAVNVTAGNHQLIARYRNIPDQTPSYIVFSIYDPNNNLFYTSRASGWSIFGIVKDAP